MIHAVLRWGDFRYILEILGSERTHARWHFHEGDTFFLGREAEAFLLEAEERAAVLLQECHESNPNINYVRLQRALASFYFDRLEDIRFGLDYNVELRSRERMVSEETYPSLYRFIVAIPGDKGFGLDRENHNFGYHIHYVQLQGKRNQRTNAIFMFNPKEPPAAKPVLYWEPHHEAAQVHINPGSFGERRRMAIYDTCTPFLNKIPKQEFKTPSNNASRLHPDISL